jgi:PAS domain S-box-containing protein
VALYRLGVSGLTAQRKLLRAAQILARGSQQAPILFVIADAEARLLWVNPAFCHLTGYGAEEVIGRPAVFLLDVAETPPEIGRAVQLAVGRGGYFHGPVPSLRKDGRRVWLELRILPLRDESGAVTHFLLFAEDITARQEAEAAVRRMNEELERRVEERTRELERRTDELAAAARELESFNYTLSHDLRRPLGAIHSFAELLEEDCGAALGPDGRDYLARIRGAAERMDALIRDLLELCRVQRAPLARERVDLARAATAIVEDLRTTAPERDVTLIVGDPLEAECDPELIRVVLENLLENAWKYTSRQPRATIEVGARVEGGRRVYFVRDDGTGFDPAHATGLFEPFRRLHRSEEFAGTGIGLATVKRAIERHGGRIWVDAAPGRGATFSFTLGPDAAG